MNKKIMFEHLEDEELDELYTAIFEERSRRAREKQEKAWAEVTTAIKKWLEDYGSIDIGEDTILQNDCSFDDIGRIYWD